MKEKLAMPCTQEQWEQEIKPRIEKIDGVEVEIGNYPYWEANKLLVNNYGRFGIVSNVAQNVDNNNLIPYDPEIEAIKQEIAIKEKELEELKSRLK